MNTKSMKWTPVLIAIAAAFQIGCATSQPSESATPAVAASPISSAVRSGATDVAIRFLEDRVSKDHDDFIAYNKLAGYYLQRQRETGSLNYLELALRAAKSSLAAMPPEMNKSGLAALAQAEFAAHEFASARDHASKLVELDREKSYPYQILGDALTELGDYTRAAAAYDEMRKMGTGVTIETRLARASLLRGNVEDAERRFTFALKLASAGGPSSETIAWIHWQLGESAFLRGDYATAEQHDRDALAAFDGYYRARAALGRALAARGDLAAAIENYERAIEITPDPTFVAALGDLYRLAGRAKDASRQYELVEQIGKLSEMSGALYNRQLSLFHADHDLKAEDAYNSARREYESRRDVYGADAVAWTALKAGKLQDAQNAINDALRLGTRDPKLFYHAGMIALAAADKAKARDFLGRALALSPQFDPLQSTNARKALESIREAN